MEKTRYFVSLCLLFFILFGGMSLFGCQGKAEESNAHIDSLNNLAYNMRYKDLKKSFRYASEAYTLSSGYKEGHAQALNNMGFVSFMRMDFKQATRLFQKVYKTTNNQIECLIADIGLMKISQRTSDNKLFYDYCNNAKQRISRIQEVRSTITAPRLIQRLNYALSEFYIVLSIYYYYLEQIPQAQEAIDNVTEELIEEDLSQKLYYLYVKGSGSLYKAPTQEKVVVGEFGLLVECLRLAETGEYIYFEANARQAIAELLIPQSHRDILTKESGGLLRLINDDNTPLDRLSLQLAEQGLQLFTQYGDWYQSSACYRSIATYYNYHNQPELALVYLSKALSYVNRHHSKYYQPTDSLDFLQVYSPYRHNSSLELEWIKRQVKTVPEWIARIREQISLTYSALGRKTESDYNRNVYLDLLDYTRQDKELERRKETLEQEEAQINIILFWVFASFLVLLLLFLFLDAHGKRKNIRHLSLLRQILTLSQKIIEAIPSDAEDATEVVKTIEDTVSKDISDMFGAQSATISLTPTTDNPPQTKGYPLLANKDEHPIGYLYISTRQPLKKEEEALLHLLLPYLTWALDNGIHLAHLETERQRLETEFYIHTRHLIENKQQNETKKACIAIASGIQPYIDRIINEVKKLRTASYAKETEIKEGKLAYIEELIAKINEYNEILATWIKIKQGDLSLHLETFDIKELLEIASKGRRGFEAKEQELTVDISSATIKADKALTLFMINTLLENAHKYTPEKGKIHLSAKEYDQYVELSVSDTGIGLSEQDIQTILGEKVYDSGSIGIRTSDNTQKLKAQKGHGFGLINCKGIIEKYKKTNPIFNVCLFGIESTLGSGSRFFFRLPKGIRKTFTCWIGILLLLTGVSCSSDPVQKPPTPHQQIAYDSLLAIANTYTNKMYNQNMQGEYRQALVYADSIIHYMNKHYKTYSGKNAPLLQIEGKENEQIADIEWLVSGYDTDYHILLDLRNEVAVAALALKDFSKYKYNNRVYTMLYKQISQDNTLEDYCIQMEQTANNKRIALFISCIFVLIAWLVYYLLNTRHRFKFRYNLEKVFQINKVMFSVPLSESEQLEDETLLKLVQTMHTELNDMLPIEEMILCIYDIESKSYRFICDKEVPLALRDDILAYHKTANTHWNKKNGWSYLPLWVTTPQEKVCIGVLAINLRHGNQQKDELLLVELIVNYFSMLLYHALVQLNYKFLDIELAKDEASRINFEHNQVHVQNMVLDNCLSTIKHETLYYPNRIKQIVSKIHNGLTAQEEEQQLETIEEVVCYYKEVFTLLLSCAERQLENVTFKRSEIPTEKIVEYAQKYLSKLLKKTDFTLYLHTEVEKALLIGDEILLCMLIENLIGEAVSYPFEGQLSLRITRVGQFMRFDFTDQRREFSQEELNHLFYPQNKSKYKDGIIQSQGFEYLICKQIIRDHDEFAGRRGCRINACKAEKGFTIWFTIPTK